MELFQLYERGSEWTASKVRGAEGHLDARTPCDEWDARTLVNHMVDTQNYFIASARGEKVDPPSPTPPDVTGDDPTGAFERARSEMLRVYGEPGVVDKTGPSLGIAFADSLIHGWDLAIATGQPAAMPDELAQAAFDMLNGRLTPEQRGNAFKPAIDVADDATAQERLLGYVGRGS